MKFLNILFAPLFVLFIHYFEFKSVVLAYLVGALIYLVYKIKTNVSKRELISPILYVVLLGIAYSFSSIQAVKYMPTTLSAMFFIMFIDSHIHKKYMILDFTKQFYKKELQKSEIEFLKRGDLYWVFVMGLNTLIHIYIVNFCSDIIWAFYSSIGWYFYFFTALIFQILYGKIYGTKVHIG
jgi:intracellular septation protein A